MNISAAIVAVLLAASPNVPMTLDTTHQLFLDDYLIASSSGVAREIHQAEKCDANPVLKPTEPWEGTEAIVYGSVIREPDKYRKVDLSPPYNLKYRIWYLTGGGVAYAESDDGIAWTKPRLFSLWCGEGA